MKTRLHISAADGTKPRRFRIEAYNGGLLPVDGFEHPVVVDLQGLETPNNVPILIDHRKEVEATLGITDAIENTGSALMLGGLVTGVSDLVQTVLAQDAKGQTWQASIGARVLESTDVPEGQVVSVNGQQIAGPFVLATKSVLKETSILPLGADSSTTVNLAASAAAVSKGVKMSFQDWLKSLGMDAATLNPEQQAALQDAYNAKMAVSAADMPADKKPDPMAAAPAVPATAAAAASVDLVASLRKEMAAEHRRASAINAAAGGFHDIAATAIEQGWSVDKTELEALKRQNAQQRTRPTSFSAAQGNGDQTRILQAALSVARGHNVEKSFSDAELQAAQTQYRGRVGLQQVIIQAAAANGMPIYAGAKLHDGNLREALQYAMGQNIQAAFSTVSLPGIFSNLANKELLAGFEEEDNNWFEISDVKSVADFKTHTSYRLLDDMEYEELGPGGVIKHGKIGEESFTRSVDTYAKMFSLTRRDIINDDLGAFDDLRTRIGRGAARRLNRLVWTTFLSNAATFWTAARTNYIEGSPSSVLGTDGVGLSNGVKAYRQRKSPLVTGAEASSQMTLGGRATKLLVPPELESVAEALYVARNLNAVKASDANIHANKYRVIVASELSDSAYGGGHSTTAWYLFGDTLKPVVTSFLNGQRSPTVESADADFNTLGIQFRGYHDFGCSQSEYLAGIKSKGAA